MCVYIYHIYIADIQQQLKWHRDDLWAYRTNYLVQNRSTRGTRGSQSVATSSTMKVKQREIRFLKYNGFCSEQMLVKLDI